MRSSRVMSSLYVVTVAVLLMAASCETPAPVEFVIFHTNDLHSNFVAPRADPYGLGGIAKLSTLIKKKRAQVANSILVDAGDWSEGNWMYSIDAGANALRALDLMGYDNVVLGNHDFLNGPDTVLKIIEEVNPRFKILAANIDVDKYPDKESLLKRLSPYDIIEKEGLRIGIIGLTTYEVLYADYLKPLILKNPVDIATAIAKELRPKVDVLILNTHNGFQENLKYAKLIPGIDAVISGHTHLKTPQAVLVKNAGKSIPVVEAGSWGRYLGQLKLAVDTAQKTVQFKDYQLVPVSEDLEDDPVMTQFVQEQKEELRSKFNKNPDEVVGVSEEVFEQSDARESLMAEMAVQAYLEETGADLALEKSSLVGISLPKGPLTYLDARNVIPHIYNLNTNSEWKLKIWSALGQDIQKALNIFHIGKVVTLFEEVLGSIATEGVSFVINTKSVLNPVESIMINGSAIDPNRRYKVALEEGMLFSFQKAKELFGITVDLSQVEDTGIEASEAVVEYIKRRGVIRVEEVRPKERAMTKGVDLTINYFGIRVDEDLKSLRIQVENHGTEDAKDIKVSCFIGNINDPVRDNTDLQKWNTIGSQKFLGLGANQNLEAVIPWSKNKIKKGIGFAPIKCQAETKSEVLMSDNSTQRVFEL